MARKHCKCADCGDVLWFGDDDLVPQSVVCHCGATTLSDVDGEIGSAVSLTTEEITAMEADPQW